jgi:hypothetical protein
MQRNQFTIKNICTAFGKFPKTKQNQTIFAVPYFNFNFIHFFFDWSNILHILFFFLFIPESEREAYTHAHRQKTKTDVYKKTNKIVRIDHALKKRANRKTKKKRTKSRSAKK